MDLPGRCRRGGHLRDRRRAKAKVDALSERQVGARIGAEHVELLPARELIFIGAGRLSPTWSRPGRFSCYNASDSDVRGGKPSMGECSDA